MRCHTKVQPILYSLLNRCILSQWGFFPCWILENLVYKFVNILPNPAVSFVFPVESYFKLKTHPFLPSWICWISYQRKTFWEAIQCQPLKAGISQSGDLTASPLFGIEMKLFEIHQHDPRFLLECKCPLSRKHTTPLKHEVSIVKLQWL